VLLVLLALEVDDEELVVAVDDVVDVLLVDDVVDMLLVADVVLGFDVVKLECVNGLVVVTIDGIDVVCGMESECEIDGGLVGRLSGTLVGTTGGVTKL